jgi:hypothetical protein
MYGNSYSAGFSFFQWPIAALKTTNARFGTVSEAIECPTNFSLSLLRTQTAKESQGRVKKISLPKQQPRQTKVRWTSVASLTVLIRRQPPRDFCLVKIR